MSNLTKRVLAVFATLLMTIGLAAAFTTGASAAPGAAKADTSADATVHATANRQARRNYFGAIAVNFRDNKAGVVYDKATKKKALNKAQKKCKAKSSHKGACAKALWVRNTCGAIAVRYNSSNQVVKAKAAFNVKKKKAIKKAKKKVGKRAKIFAWVCTTRRA